MADLALEVIGEEASTELSTSFADVADGAGDADSSGVSLLDGWYQTKPD